MTQYLLLTGAGFSRNWGCWLASEVWNAIYGQSAIQSDGILKKLLWDTKKEGFERALEEARSSLPPDKVIALENAVVAAFRRMDQGIISLATPRIPHSDIVTIEARIMDLLVRFVAFFTLNQDYLVERRLEGNLGIRLSPHRSGIIKPGIRPVGTAENPEELVDLARFLRCTPSSRPATGVI